MSNNPNSMEFEFDESILAKWDQRKGLAPPPYTGPMARLVKGAKIGDPYMDSLPMSAVICHGGKTKDSLALQPHPEWVDWASVKRGQDVFMEHLGQSYIALSLSLIQGFSIGRFSEVLIANGYAQSAETAFDRYRETAFAIVDWMRYPLDAEGSKSQRQMTNVRAMHSFARRQSKKLMNPDSEGLALSQYDMAEVLLGFAGICPMLLEVEMGVVMTLQEKTDLCHTWRLIGYHLGIQDEFNCANSLPELEAMVHEFMQFTPARWRTCRPSTFDLQRTALDGFGLYTGLGAEYFVGILTYTCNSRAWGIDYLERPSLPGMDIVGHKLLRLCGNKTFNWFISKHVVLMRDSWESNPSRQKSLMPILATVSRGMDLVVWRLIGRIALFLRSYQKRFLVGYLLGIFLSRMLLKRLL